MNLFSVSFKSRKSKSESVHLHVLQFQDFTIYCMCFNNNNNYSHFFSLCTRKSKLTQSEAPPTQDNTYKISPTSKRQRWTTLTAPSAKPTSRPKEFCKSTRSEGVVKRCTAAMTVERGRSSAWKTTRITALQNLMTVKNARKASRTRTCWNTMRSTMPTKENLDVTNAENVSI